MSYLYTGSKSSSATNTGLSTQILCKVDGNTIGAIQSIRLQQNRPIRDVVEVGTDGVIELVPNAATKFTLSIDRIMFDRKSITEAMSRAFINIQAQRIPFDIYIYDFGGVPNNATADDGDMLANSMEGVMTTIYENCWFQSKTQNITATDYIMSESAEVMAEFCHTFMNGDAEQNASAGTPRGGPDKIELLADRSRAGSLDARGLNSLSGFFGDIVDLT